MIQLIHFQARDCSAYSGEHQLCAFKQLWFRDMPFLILPDLENSSLPVAKRTIRKLQALINRQLLDVILPKFCVKLAVRMRELNRRLLRPLILNKLTTSSESRVTDTDDVARCRKTSPSLLSVPVELRLKIFDYVTESTSIDVVGYRHGKRDSFYFKSRGSCPVALTCKQFHNEILDIYFRKVTVNIKAACPSQFTGDMSTFGAPTFRNLLRNVRIADPDETRRLRMCAAFQNAHIEHSHKYAAGSRSGAYYFN